jgi:hypothetical protein
MNKWICGGALALGLVALWPSGRPEAADPHVFRFQAQWNVNPDGSDCDTPNSSLALFINASDVDVVQFDYQFNLDPCNPTSPLQRFTGAGQLDISGNQTRLFVEGTLTLFADGRQVDVDLMLRKTGDLPDPGPGEKLVSATARGEVILDGEDLTGGLPSTTAQISRSRS